eukprot:scaffold477_cov355-Pinguiococcus_pyrenoidosus.AAC.16
MSSIGPSKWPKRTRPPSRHSSVRASMLAAASLLLALRTKLQKALVGENGGKISSDPTDNCQLIQAPKTQRLRRVCFTSL